jgi:FkbM family methyltransferase
VIARTPLPAAPSDRFRRRPVLEAAGEWFRRVPFGAGVRDRLKGAYHSVLMMQTGGRGLACRLPHGEVIHALPRHRHLSWNPAEYEAFRAAVRPGAVALDIGANVGAYSLLLGQWVGPAGRVFAFEPAPEIFDGLRRHVALNDLSAVVTPIAAAAGARTATSRLIVAGTVGESRLASARDRDAATVEVALTTIDRFCSERALLPDFIKVDVEGFELDVLRGARETIRRAGPGLALFVEMHPSVWPLVGVSREEILAELESQSLEIVPLAEVPDVWAIEGMCVRLARRC